MSRFLPANYRLQMLVLMALYIGMLLLEWPLAKRTTGLPLKTVLTLTPLLPMIAALWLIARPSCAATNSTSACIWLP